LINFLILAFIIFLLVRFVKKVVEEVERKGEPSPAGPSEVDLLTEIRDELRRKG
jgi:large conductance mechanosensitive channel